MKSYSIGSVSLACTILGELQLLLVQARTKGKGWFHVPGTYKYHGIVDDEIQIDFYDLRPDETYSFRVIAVDKKSEKQFILVYNDLKPTGKYKTFCNIFRYK